VCRPIVAVMAEASDIASRSPPRRADSSDSRRPVARGGRSGRGIPVGKPLRRERPLRNDRAHGVRQQAEVSQRGDRVGVDISRIGDGAVGDKRTGARQLIDGEGGERLPVLLSAIERKMG